MSLDKIPRACSVIPKVLASRSSITLAQCLAVGLHLGHSPKVWNPAMNRFIYGVRQGIHIINLDHTLYALKRASLFTEQVALRGGKIVFLGSRRFLHPVVVEAAFNGKAYFITEWIGGMLTNKERTLKRSVGYDPNKLVQTMEEDEEEESNSKKRSGQPFVHSPDLVIILDYPNNLWAVKECNYYGIPVIALCDSDSDPTLVQYPIPGNDDSHAGVELVAQVLSEASRKGCETRETLPLTEINKLS
jgi:small subunit ribosomal protein S2